MKRRKIRKAKGVPGNQTGAIAVSMDPWKESVFKPILMREDYNIQEIVRNKDVTIFKIKLHRSGEKIPARKLLKMERILKECEEAAKKSGKQPKQQKKVSVLEYVRMRFVDYASERYPRGMEWNSDRHCELIQTFVIGAFVMNSMRDPELDAFVAGMSLEGWKPSELWRWEAFDLPIMQSCEGCGGACCREQESPPMYAYLLMNRDDPDLAGDIGDELKRDLARVDALPEPLKEELRQYYRDRQNQVPRKDECCIWLDRETGKCKHYDHRPEICREGVKLNDDACFQWRGAYKPDGTERRSSE